MAENSTIEWTDHTWVPIAGCDAISPACAFCYAALMAARLEAMGNAKYAGLATRHGNIGKWTGKVNLSEADVVKPLHVKKPGRWFLTSMGDVFHRKVPFDFLDQLFAVMALADRHTFYVLTKRLDVAAEYLGPSPELGGMTRDVMVEGEAQAIHHKRTGEDPSMWLAVHWPLPNVFIGCTVEDQERADERNPYMRDIAAAGWRTFVSYEPALGPVDWSEWGFLSWLISGGESGQKARPSHPDWHRSARDFCQARGIPYLFKQWGEWLDERDATMRHMAPGPSMYDGEGMPKGPCWHFYDGEDVLGGAMIRVGKKAAGRLLDGREWNEMPGARE